ncbi:MAG: T9SS type A sorting domain-containing protein [candidate division Zixibacteria bacterium]|jgi:hypothetical protein|nr:T9SS type A sorting domain-containing protein [candidate division Zixibacteria bacterium]
MSGKRWILASALVLLAVIPASAQYNVRIGQSDPVCPSTNVTVGITIEPAVPNPEPIGGFDLHFSYNPMALSMVSITAGEFYAECGWEYFTYSIGSTYPGCCANCPSVKVVHLIGLADINNGAVHPTCFAPTDETELVRLRFFVGGSPQYANTVQPVNFYWLPGENCGLVAFSSQSGDDLFIAQNVYDYTGQPFPAGYNCSGPDEDCPGEGIIPYINYYDGAVEITEQDVPYRGDVNLDGVSYEIGDAVLFTNYFLYGLGVFTVNPSIQVAATEVNCDGISLTVGDLVYLIRIIVGDVEPYCTCDDKSGAVASLEGASAQESIYDTLAFFGATGYQGQQHIPFDIYVANSVPIAGLQLRMEFDPACVTPDFDPIIGDGQSVEYALVGRAADYLQDNGNIIVKSVEPGVLLVYMYPTFGQALPVIASGSGVVLKVYFNANPPITPREGPVTFVTEGYDYNLFADLYGQAILPTLVGDLFQFVAPPSCPVLFSFDGSGYTMENPLLTACEESGYRDVVTDYYQTSHAVPDASGTVRFQLRELEDEVTLLDEIELITVDHSVSTQVMCDTDGRIRTYDRMVEPLSAVDHNGVDRLAEVGGSDGTLFAADGPGYLIVEFPVDGRAEIGVLASSAPKRPCLRDPGDPLDKSGPGTGETGYSGASSTVEVLSAGDAWRTVASNPTRSHAVDQAVWISTTDLSDTRTVTVRIAWSESYATDAVVALVPSVETPAISAWSPTEVRLTAAGKAGADPAHAGESTVTLMKGDVYEVTFDVGSAPSGLAREYIVKATGRYHPAAATELGGLADSYQLFENYPNPFNPTTTITYYLPQATHTRVQVFNTLGQRVTTLVDQVQGSGSHAVVWDGTDQAGRIVASGTYYYRLETSDFRQTKKMVFVK